MRHRWFSVVLATTLLLGVVGATATGAGAGSTPDVIPFHPISPQYAAIKAGVDAQARAQDARDTADASTDVQPFAPTAPVKWGGLGPNGYSPSDARGAISPTEYVETVNVRVGVYSRTGALLSTNTQAAWTGIANAKGDADIVWDNSQNRYFASMLNLSSTYALIFGFSKGPSPTAAAADWCFYSSTFGGRYGTNLPDYPKLGMTNDFILMGVNTFANAQTYIGSDVAWVSKPPSGVLTTCPSLSNLPLGVKQLLKNADGSNASTPVPANLVDGGSTGYVVANKDPNGGTSTVLSLFKVTNVGGSAVFSAPTTVSVAGYSYPPNAPQLGTTDLLDTLDGRLMNDVAAVDPTNNNGKVSVWTQHTVKASTGGKGAEVRWYEIDGATGALVQSGIAHSKGLYTFMGAVSPDRNGASGQFGGNMVLVFNTSSATKLAAAKMVSKIGANPQSAFVKVKGSTAADTDFTCSPVCRWGDYAGATPDPASTSSGAVWATVMMSQTGSPGWTTENWEAIP